MATRIEPILPTRAYVSESATQLAAVTGTVMTAGVDYIVNVSRGDILAVFDNDTLGATNIIINGSDDPKGRVNTINDPLGSPLVGAYRLSRVGWADENGDVTVQTDTSDVTAYFYRITPLP